MNTVDDPQHFTELALLNVFSAMLTVRSCRERRPRRSKEKTGRIIQWNAEGGIPYGRKSLIFPVIFAN